MTDALPHVVTSLGPVKSHVRAVAEEIAQRWADRLPLYFIWGAPGRGTGDHARGLALDFMTYELGGGVDDPGPMRDQLGHEIAAYVLTHRRRLNVDYVIWQRRIASELSDPEWAWRPYTGSNPHRDHPHVSFKATGTYQPPPTTEDPDMLTPEDIENVARRTADLVWFERIANPLSNPGTVAPHASEYLVGQGNEIDGLKRALNRVERMIESMREDPEG